MLYWSDAWLLAAIDSAAKSGSADLAAVIEHADALNHAMLTYEELDCGLFRLARTGWIEKCGPPFTLSEQTKGQRALDVVGFAKTADVANLMGIPRSMTDKPLRAHDPSNAWGISHEEVMKAESAYRRSFARRLKELHKRDGA